MATPFISNWRDIQMQRLVLLSGSFNDWNTAELSMKRTATGWEIPYVLAPGNYEYKFIVDGQWLPDPANPAGWDQGDHINSIRVIDPNYTFILKGFPQAKEGIAERKLQRLGRARLFHAKEKW
jgi:1,4-alpha-glucan branching enzyme